MDERATVRGYYKNVSCQIRNINKNNVQATDVYRLCCCCLELVCLKSLWAEYVWMGRTEVYGNMLKECFNLTMPQTAESKEQICEVCITQLRNAVHFKQKVLQCQATIRAQLIDITRIVKEEQLESGAEFNKSDCEVIIENKTTGAELADVFDGHEDDDQMGDDDDLPTRKTEKRKVTVKSKSKRRILFGKKHEKVEKRRDIRNVNYVKPRQNVCLILEHSTIVPFRSNKGYFNCLYCNKQYVVFDELKSHISLDHENIDFKSIIKSILRPHDRIRADISDIKCRICKKSLDNLEVLVKHLNDEHGVKFNFDTTMKPTDCILGYDLSGGKFKCFECKEDFLFFKTLTQHMNEHSTDYVCDVCGRCFLLPERLRAHARLHIGKSVKCDICEKVCSSIILLKSHIRYAHKKISFMCSICNQTFPSYRSRMRHLEEIHNRAPLNLTCKICSKTFLQPNSLNSHMRTDHLKIPKVPKHGCNECGMMFKSRYALSYHMIVHSGEKNYECDICHKKYARSKTLTEHLKIHMNDRRWSCGACSQAFVQKCSLKNHIRVHHVDMDYDRLIVYKKPDSK